MRISLALFVVLGHEGYGPIKATLTTLLESHLHDYYLQTLVDNILTGLGDLNSESSEQERLSRAIEANVRWSMHQILETPDGGNTVKAGAKLVEAVYEIASGHVRLLS